MSGDTLAYPASAAAEFSATTMGGVPLLERTHNSGGPEQWRPRLVFDLNHDLSKRCGLPIEISSKMGSLAAIARALDRGDLVHALIAAPHLQLPDPPDLAKSAPTVSEVIDLARNLKASGLLKADWDPTEHPRWPASSPGGIGGEFAPSGSANTDSPLVEPSPKLLPAQLTIPAPFEIPGIPLPSEVLPAPILPPNISPLHIPRNPYPGRRKCDNLEVKLRVSANEWLQQNPRNAQAYFRRHFVWMDVGHPQRALNDLDQVIELAPTQAAFCARGIVHRQLGEHEAALADFQRGETIDAQEWKDAWITLLYEA